MTDNAKIHEYELGRINFFEAVHFDDGSTRFPAVAVVKLHINMSLPGQNRIGHEIELTLRLMTNPDTKLADLKASARHAAETTLRDALAVMARQIDATGNLIP